MKDDFFERIKSGRAHVDGPQYLVNQRHWGYTVVLDANTRINFINDEPSTHFHRYRVEEYILYSGEMTVYTGAYFEGDIEKTVAHLEAVNLLPGDKIVIPLNTVHIPLPGIKTDAVFIEISHGPYEDGDVERVYDKSGRDPDLAKRWLDLGYAQGLGIRDLISLTKEKLNSTV